MACEKAKHMMMISNTDGSSTEKLFSMKDGARSKRSVATHSTAFSKFPLTSAKTSDTITIRRSTI